MLPAFLNGGLVVAVVVLVGFFGGAIALSYLGRSLGRLADRWYPPVEGRDE